MIRPYKDITPRIHDNSFIADNATVIGRVTIKENANIWFGAVIRGDVNDISIGCNTNIQDNSVVHVADPFPCVIGDNVTVGHSAIVHACTIGNNVLVGMGAIVLDGATVEDNVIIGAGALVPPGKTIPANSLVVGSPCKVVRQLTDEEVEHLQYSADKYVGLSKNYK